ncbi:MAG: GNAT family protein [Planctomycetota bacterium]
MAPRGAVEAGERVFLRRPRARDEEEFVALLKKSRPFLRPFEPRPPRGVSAAGPERFATLLRASRGKRGEKLLIFRRQDGVLLGNVNASEIVRGAFHSCYLGYWIGAPFARQGYMTEALGLMLRHAFTTLGLHRVEANIIPTNTPSQRLVKRLGFRREGLSKDYLKIDGRWQDHARYALLVDEWRARVRGKGGR